MENVQHQPVTRWPGRGAGAAGGSSVDPSQRTSTLRSTTYARIAAPSLRPLIRARHCQQQLSSQLPFLVSDQGHSILIPPRRSIVELVLQPALNASAAVRPAASSHRRAFLLSLSRSTTGLHQDDRLTTPMALLRSEPSKIIFSRSAGCLRRLHQSTLTAPACNCLSTARPAGGRPNKIGRISSDRWSQSPHSADFDGRWRPSLIGIRRCFRFDAARRPVGAESSALFWQGGSSLISPGPTARRAQGAARGTMRPARQKKRRPRALPHRSELPTRAGPARPARPRRRTPPTRTPTLPGPGATSCRDQGRKQASNATRVASQTPN